MQTKLAHKLGQRLALTPQLTQSLKVLAMNSMELDAYLEESIESNPMLDIDFNATPTTDAAGEERALEISEQDQWREQGDNRWETMYASASRDDYNEREPLWQQEQSLSESLHEQVDRQPMSEAEHRIAHMLIDSLDDDGYFRLGTDAFVREVADEITTDAEAVDNVLHNVIQQLDPSGLGARDLTECLLLQLDGSQEIDIWVKRLLLHYSDKLLLPDDELAAAADCDVETVQLARSRMRRLDPFPGHGLRGEENYYIRPEIVFRRNSNNDIEVDIPGTGWRGIRLNEQWKEHEWKGKDKEFMSQAMKEAKWLLHALDQRSETLMKVALCLAERQRAFLEYGILGLKPLTLQDVAEDVGLHESTISRVTNSKYAETPIGLIELRRFFSAGLPTRGGGTISVYRVQQRVKALIDSEPAGRPISDQAIADRLQAEGIEIARRTVAKYREQLGLPPSSQRRRTARSRQ
ncbi:RNA polymerase factor sigma-54 [Mariprofundus ferrooxydans]|uniref:RNA polymerase sigma-54 factor n=1 Tax=Mariprofundus ferrooxydans PV-1 TaxID=314345 RepID=Q0EWW0_9PROT|nr:RNA polymerase factor sigma-54 [Mariprofundus ferrooxydans]EAU53797.1 DNA-directed RNA polymerase subunit N [Mariprofundus ferrooxydans PV-1]KON47545.1 DNA-directed RNA polymerase subunit N [Mariprofundus ferrooxydans]